MTHKIVIETKLIFETEISLVKTLSKDNIYLN